ncbi:MAG: helix-turn-helix transcriptional regulator, partial [Oscillochloris sp.]|nr:helix-turn-helix transcriptional regulator [Oscillochloris sp.]
MDAGLPLLLTKLELPPMRPRLLRRPQLLALLPHAPGTRLVLASAPAGFGKTTLLTSWCHSLIVDAHTTVAWVALDESDNDPARFLAYLIAAVTRALGTPDSVEPPDLSDASSGAEATLTQLINKIVTAHRDCLLVLDDYQVITAPAIHSVIAFLLDHLPERACLAISSRSDPPLPLARLHVRAQLVELRAADLRFSDTELQSFLGMAGVVDLPPAEITAITALVEGWPAGAQLVALAKRSGALLQQNRGDAPHTLRLSEGHERLFD